MSIAKLLVIDLGVFYGRDCVSRGLQAQMKDLNDVNLVLKALYQRTPLMTNTWKSERMVRQETHPHQLSLHKTISSSAKPHAKPGAKLNRPKGSLNPANIIASGAIKKSQEPLITENLVDSIPGGMKASIARIVLVAAMKSFDPDADGGDGAFALREDCTSDPFESYLKLESPLLKVKLYSRQDRSNNHSRLFYFYASSDTS